MIRFCEGKTFGAGEFDHAWAAYIRQDMKEQFKPHLVLDSPVTKVHQLLEDITKGNPWGGFSLMRKLKSKANSVRQVTFRPPLDPL